MGRQGIATVSFIACDKLRVPANARPVSHLIYQMLPETTLGGSIPILTDNCARARAARGPYSRTDRLSNPSFPVGAIRYCKVGKVPGNLDLVAWLLERKTKAWGSGDANRKELRLGSQDRYSISCSRSHERLDGEVKRIS